jgi:peptidylprolyl isomerase
MRFSVFFAAVCAFALIAGVNAIARAAPTAPPAEADWRTPDPQNVLVIDTSKGRVFVELAPQVAPATAARLRDLTRAGFYDGRAFFRVIDGFMDQTGDPQDDGKGGSTQPNVPPEFTFRRGASTPMVSVMKTDGLEAGFIGSLPVLSQSIDLAALTADGKVKAWGTFCPEVAGMARAEAPDSGNSQFFLMRDAHTQLDQQYTPFGRAIGGLDVIRAIKTGEPPQSPMDTMTKVRVLADIPQAERPKVRVIDPAGPWFRAMVDRVRVQKIIDFSVCDLEFPSQIK